MTLRHLQIFSCVCREGSITDAAAELGITQPAVSIAVKELETFCGAQLFERVGKNSFLTEKGRLLKRYSDTILSQYDEAVSVVRDDRGICRCGLGVNISAAETLLPSVIKRIEKEIPGLSVSINVSNSGLLEEKLEANEIDLAIMDFRAGRGDLTALPFFREKMVLVCSKEYYPDDSIDIDRLAQMKLMLREEGSGSRACIEALFAAHGIHPKTVMSSHSTLALIEMARCGMGFTVIPLLLAEKESGESLHIVDIAGETLERFYYIVYYTKKYFSPSMEFFIDLLKNFDKNGNV